MQDYQFVAGFMATTLGALFLATNAATYFMARKKLEYGITPEQIEGFVVDEKKRSPIRHVFGTVGISLALKTYRK